MWDRQLPGSSWLHFQAVWYRKSPRRGLAIQYLISLTVKSMDHQTNN